VLDAWRSYIDPIREMVDPEGPFEELFGFMEVELHSAISRLAGLGGLIRDQRIFDVLLYRLIQLRSDVKRHLSVATEQLLPLVREVRRNSVIARGASIAVKRIRASGIQAVPIPEWIPINRRIEPTAIAADDHIEAYVAGLGSYVPEPQTFLQDREEKVEHPVRVDPESVSARLHADLPVSDLLQWLIDGYGGTAGVDDILDLYFTWTRGKADLRVRRGPGQWYETPTHRIHAPRLRILAAPGRRTSDED
jgi:hypothetical protein